MRPADRVVVVGFRRAEVIDLRYQALGGLEMPESAERHHLVERALQRTFGGCAVVADDEIDERIFEDAQISQRVEHSPDMVVGLLHETRVHFHLTSQHRLHLWIDAVPCRNLRMSRCQLAVLRNHAELQLSSVGFFAQLVPSLIELALVLVGPLLRHVMRRMGRAGGVVDEERVIGRECLLLMNPRDRAIGEIFVERVSLLRCPGRLDARGSFVETGIVLIGLATEESIEVLEAPAAGRPMIERSDRAGFPDWDFVALAELRCGIAIELQRFSESRAGVRFHGVRSWGRGRELRDASHAD